MEGFFFYFAYGSNMLTARLKARCPNAEPVGIGEVEGFSIAFSKPSIDTSGKATLIAEDGGRSQGVVFKIREDDLSALDEAEGSGYQRRDDFTVRLKGGVGELRVKTYLATKTEATLRPYDWYLALVMAGAREHKLADEYTKTLSQTSYVVDQNLKRKSRIAAVKALEEAGYPDLEILLS